VIQIVTSFRTSESIIDITGSSFFSFTLENYRNILLAEPPFLRYLFNSFLVGISTTALALAIVIRIHTAFGTIEDDKIQQEIK